MKKIIIASVAAMMLSACGPTTPEHKPMMKQVIYECSAVNSRMTHNSNENHRNVRNAFSVIWDEADISRGAVLQYAYASYKAEVRASFHGTYWEGSNGTDTIQIPSDFKYAIMSNEKSGFQLRSTYHDCVEQK